jgi:hypothetical protein
MQHLNEEQLVAHYYHDDDAPAQAESHLVECTECRLQYETIRRVLTLVTESPVPERGNDYADEVWTRLRWKLGARKRRVQRWASFVAAAAVLAIAFFTGVWWHSRGGQAPTPVQLTASNNATIGQAGAHVLQTSDRDRVLLVVVSDHLESSERMLAELANANPNHTFDVPSDRAADLVASNRMYRQTAANHGDQRIASLLSDLEPILVELSHAGKTLSPDELSSIQKRIESKQLLFKVRIVSAQTGSGGGEPAPAHSNSL